MGKIRKEVVAVDRSPMNRKRWCLELSCGHEVWVTSTKRPVRAMATCDKCADIEARWPSND